MYFLCVDKEIREASTLSDKKMSEFEVEMRYLRFCQLCIILCEGCYTLFIMSGFSLP